VEQPGEPAPAFGRPGDAASSLVGLGAVVLAGGRSSRFQRPEAGGDKIHELVDGMTLLGHALRAVPAAVPCVVVGPRWPDDAGLPRAADLIWALEERRFTGPAVALGAGVEHLPQGIIDVLVLAADQPFAASAVRVLVALRARLAASGGPECCVAVDEDGVRQPLLGLYALAPLRRAMRAVGVPGESGESVGGSRAGGSERAPSLRSVLAGLRVLEVAVPLGSTTDVDTPDDLDQARARAHPR
jgi:molybdopterin-guanine dinucleotide biosynthesis protein A